jgi:glycosyltransferase involved in cell wall biosynthesis
VLFVCDSDFNKEELVSLGAPAEACRVLPPLHLTEQLGREQWDLRTWERYRKDVPNILFVGGIKPNKGHARAIEVLAAYRRIFRERARLIFAGSDPRIGAYREEVVEITREMRVEADVIFTGAIHSSALKTLYMLADAFLCLSEHEGFCVPLVEAMYFRVPIVAWGVTAVAETAADAAMLTETGAVTALAEHVRRCIVDREWAARLATLGRERYEKRFHPQILRAQLRGVVDEAMSGAAHGIARDHAGGCAD